MSAIRREHVEGRVSPEGEVLIVIAHGKIFKVENLGNVAKDMAKFLKLNV